MKNKKLSVILISIAILLVVVGATAGIAYAIWKESTDTTQDITVEINPNNPSLQYIIFSAIDADGNIVADPGEAVAYAAVGYRGLVAEVVIPDTCNGKPVTHILVDSNCLENRWANMHLITRITIPASVVYIGQGVFSSMDGLTRVDFLFEDGCAPLIIGDLAFAGCSHLTTFNCGRDVDGNQQSYLQATPAAAS